MGDLRQLSDAAAPGPWRHQPLGDYGEHEDRFITDGKSNLATDVCPEEADFIVALVNAYREGQLIERE